MFEPDFDALARRRNAVGVHDAWLAQGVWEFQAYSSVVEGEVSRLAFEGFAAGFAVLYHTGGYRGEGDGCVAVDAASTAVLFGMVDACLIDEVLVDLAVAVVVDSIARFGLRQGSVADVA